LLQIANWKTIGLSRIKIWVVRRRVFSHPSIGPDSAVPAHVTRRQIANVVESHEASQTITSIDVGDKPARLNAQPLPFPTFRKFVKIVSPTPDDEGLASEPQFPKWNRKQRFVADQNVRLESRGHHGTIRKIARDLNPRQLQSSLRVVYMTKEGVADPAPDFHIQVITLFKIAILIAERRLAGHRCPTKDIHTCVKHPD
jgi:hypothetical protein